MVWVVAGYLIAVAAALLAALAEITIDGLIPALKAFEPLVNCALIGGIGGCLYCLRAVYLNACVHQRWSKAWVPWYFIRPATSFLSGGVSYLFLFSGLLVLDSRPASGASHVGFYALAFIAGLNVDRFLAKVEDIASTTWGIDKSRAARESATTQGERKDGDR